MSTGRRSVQGAAQFSMQHNYHSHDGCFSNPPVNLVVLIFYFMCMSVLSVGHMCAVPVRQKGPSDLLGLVLQMVVSYHMGPGN